MLRAALGSREARHARAAAQGDAQILAARNADEEVLVHATTPDGSVAVCEVTGHTTIA